MSRFKLGGKVYLNPNSLCITCLAIFTMAWVIQMPEVAWSQPAFLVKDINSTAPSFPSASYPYAITDVNGVAFFSADDGVHGSEIWSSNGTPAGTVLVHDIHPGINPSYFNDQANVGGTFYFSSDDGAYGGELWKSDGTSSGTVLVKDIVPGAFGSFPFGFVSLGSTLLFGAMDNATGSELWKSDGTPGGTSLVLDINPGINSGVFFAFPESFYSIGSAVLFLADNGTSGTELWRSDGTPGGTSM